MAGKYYFTISCWCEHQQRREAGFMNTIQDFQKEDKAKGKGTDIKVQFDKNSSNSVADAPTKVTLPDDEKIKQYEK